MCQSAELETETYELARILSTRSLSAIRGMKQLISLVTAEVSKGDQREAQNIIRSSLSHPDYTEGVQAFLEHREPRFL